MIVKYDGKIRWGAFAEEEDGEEHVNEEVVVMRNGTCIRIEERPLGNYSVIVEHKEK